MARLVWIVRLRRVLLPGAPMSPLAFFHAADGNISAFPVPPLLFRILPGFAQFFSNKDVNDIRCPWRNQLRLAASTAPDSSHLRSQWYNRSISRNAACDSRGLVSCAVKNFRRACAQHPARTRSRVLPRITPVRLVAVALQYIPKHPLQMLAKTLIYPRFSAGPETRCGHRVSPSPFAMAPLSRHFPTRREVAFRAFSWP